MIYKHALASIPDQRTGVDYRLRQNPGHHRQMAAIAAGAGARL
jgi:hypothetical protein